MNSVILTELGIIVTGTKTGTFPFSDPCGQYIAVKKREGVPNALIRHLDEAGEGFLSSDQDLLFLLKKSDIDAQMLDEGEIARIHAKKPELLTDAGFARDHTDALKQLRDFAVSLSESKVTSISESPDLHVIQAINSLDEIERITNALGSRLREWYGLHFPELENLIDSVNGYVQIAAAGSRDDMDRSTFENAGFPDSKVEMLMTVLQKSKGGAISRQNLAMIGGMADQSAGLYELRKMLESHVREQMHETAPNLAAILGDALGARLLARAGSLKRLAAMPASTIQILGAERALFRSLKTGSRPPKHGLLFQHSMVHAAPRWQRGKIARAVAAKAAIAARVDMHGGGLNDTLLEKLNVRVSEIGKKYKEPVRHQAGEKAARQDTIPGAGRRRDESYRTQTRDDRTTYESRCDQCGASFRIPFRPTQGRPVYCNDCFGKKGRHAEGRRKTKKRKRFGRR